MVAGSGGVGPVCAIARPAPSTVKASLEIIRG
jgi:hypothetical protein